MMHLCAMITLRWWIRANLMDLMTETFESPSCELILLGQTHLFLFVWMNVVFGFYLCSFRTSIRLRWTTNQHLQLLYKSHTVGPRKGCMWTHNDTLLTLCHQLLRITQGIVSLVATNFYDAFDLGSLFSVVSWNHSSGFGSLNYS